MASKSGGRSPAQGKSRVSRVPAKAGPARKDAGPVKSQADLAENTWPRRGAGPTRVGANTPVATKGRSPAARGIAGQPKDMSRSATGTTIAQKANAGAPGKARGR